MNLTAKKSIDLITPTLAAGVITFYFFKKGKSPQFLLGVALVVFLLVYIITSQVTKAIVTAPPASIPLPKDTSLTNCPDFDGKAIVDALKADYDSFFTLGDTDNYNKIIALSNCELVRCYNQWNTAYYTTTQKTMAAVFAGWDSGGHGFSWLSDAHPLVHAINQRFLSLNLK